ncbi:MAG: hypothetical protein M1426_01155 [Patescibacteria group bacterium]|nr:hypothetical protein [Patescibacteria group bacterium]
MASSSNFALSQMATALVNVFTEEKIENTDKKITVNQLLSKIASWYEKLRTSMDYGDEETIFRKAIERILKRKLFLDTNPQAMAQGLVRELIWARYFPDASVPESIINMVAQSIALHLRLRERLSKGKALPENKLNEFITQILSREIDTILVPRKEKEAMINFMFQILKDSIEINDDSKQTRDAQVFIAVRKNFAKDDIASLRYELFKQIFGKLSEQNLEKTALSFKDGYKEIEHQLLYPKKNRIFNHIKKKTPPFLILYDVLIQEKNNIKTLIKNEEEFRNIIFYVCERRYTNIRSKVKTAIIRSFVFILFTKAFIALFIEGVFERVFLGSVQWLSIAINTTVPPLLMIISGLAIKTPDRSNSQKIFLDIQRILFLENPQIVQKISIKTKTGNRTLWDYIFSFLWLITSLFSFGIIIFILTKLHFNVLSQGIFLFFIAIISFLTYRIYQTANIYSVATKQGLFAPLVDFLFVPIVSVGRRLTEGITQVNFILMVIDLIIEAPFKGLVGFFEQWFLFLSIKREELE